MSICADGINYEVLDAAIIDLILEYRRGVNSSAYNMTLQPIQLSKLYNKKFRNEVKMTPLYQSPKYFRHNVHSTGYQIMQH